MIAVEYERVFAEHAKKRMLAGVKPDPAESLPEGSGVATDEADFQESLPESSHPQATVKVWKICQTLNRLSLRMRRVRSSDGERLWKVCHNLTDAYKAP